MDVTYADKLCILPIFKGCISMRKIFIFSKNIW